MKRLYKNKNIYNITVQLVQLQHSHICRKANIIKTLLSSTRNLRNLLLTISFRVYNFRLFYNNF